MSALADIYKQALDKIHSLVGESDKRESLPLKNGSALKSAAQPLSTTATASDDTLAPVTEEDDEPKKVIPIKTGASKLGPKK